MPLTILAKERDAIGTDVYRDDADKTLPIAFRPTSTQTVRVNADQSNNNTTIETIVPVVVTTPTGVVSTDSYKMVTKINALQKTISPTAQQLCVSLHQKHVTAALANGALEGNLPLNPLVLDK